MTYGRLLMIGCGRMGGALLPQWLATKAWQGPITIVKPTPELPEALNTQRGVRHAATLEEAEEGAPVGLIVLAIKPQLIPEILPGLAARFGDAVPYLTIAAGVRLAHYRSRLGEDARIIRSMPNSPSLIGMGMSTLCASSTSTMADRELAEALMKAVGETLWLDDEAMMDVATAISGSGPAYVFYFMECLISAAMESGLDEKSARLLVVQTLHGSSELAYLTGEPLSLLRSDVTSPGGTTEAALARLMHPTGMLRLAHEAVRAALDRAAELSALAK